MMVEKVNKDPRFYAQMAHYLIKPNLHVIGGIMYIATKHRVYTGKFGKIG